MARKRFYRIGELAKLVGVSSRTVDYYTQLGLLQPIQRSNANYRLYDDSARELLSRIRQLQEHHLPLAEIRDRLARATMQDSSATRLDRVNELVRELKREAAELVAARPHLVAACEQDREARLALTRAASALLQQALVLSHIISSLVEESGVKNFPL